MTSNDGSVGLNAFSGSISATGTTITTEGGLDILSNPSYGVEVSNSGATVTLTDDTIMTSGPGAVGLLAQASGMATLSGTANITTTDLTNTQGSAIGLYALSGGIIDGSTTTSVSVTTSGTGAIGVYASGVAPPADPGGTPTPSTITIGGLATISTYGSSAAGVQADNGGVVNSSGGSVETPNSLITTIADGSIGVYAASAGIININGVTTSRPGRPARPRAASTLMASTPTARGRGQSQRCDDGDDERDRRFRDHRLWALRQQRRDDRHAGTPAVKVTTYGAGAIGVYASGTAPLHRPRRRRSRSGAPSRS